MTVIGRVIELWRYPVSSVAGEMVDTLSISEAGIFHDRDFGIVDCATGDVASPGRDERWRPALAVHARVGGEGEAQIRVPGSGWNSVLSDETRNALAAHFGFAAEVRPYQDKAALPSYDGPWAVNRYQPSSLHLLTTASIAELQRLHPNGNPDRRRFRPNIVVEMDGIEGSFPETEWLGRTLRVGELALTIDEPTRRCGMTVIAQDDISHDPEILRQLVRNNGHNIGVYCAPQRPGTLRLGDKVHLQ